jgi:hypothetical protein
MQNHLPRILLAMCMTAAVGCAATVSFTFSAPMTTNQEIPIPTVPAGFNPMGSASATLTYNDANLGAGGTLLTSLSWSDLTSAALMAHIHAINNPAVCRSDNGRCGVGPVLIPIFMTDAGITPGAPGGPLPTTGSYSATIGVNATQLATLVSGLQLDPPQVGALYFNLHTLLNTPGEIRGDITSAEAVPEPGSVALLSLGLLCMAAGARRPKARS